MVGWMETVPTVPLRRSESASAWLARHTLIKVVVRGTVHTNAIGHKQSLLSSVGPYIPLANIKPGTKVQLRFLADPLHQAAGGDDANAHSQLHAYQLVKPSLTLEFEPPLGIEISLHATLPPGMDVYFVMYKDHLNADGLFVSTSPVSPGGVPLARPPEPKPGEASEPDSLRELVERIGPDPPKGPMRFSGGGGVRGFSLDGGSGKRVEEGGGQNSTLDDANNANNGDRVKGTEKDEDSNHHHADRFATVHEKGCCNGPWGDWPPRVKPGMGVGPAPSTTWGAWLNLHLDYEIGSIPSVDLFRALGSYSRRRLVRSGFNLWFDSPDHVAMVFEFESLSLSELDTRLSLPLDWTDYSPLFSTWPEFEWAQASWERSGAWDLGVRGAPSRPRLEALPAVSVGVGLALVFALLALLISRERRPRLCWRWSTGCAGRVAARHPRQKHLNPPAHPPLRPSPIGEKDAHTTADMGDEARRIVSIMMRSRNQRSRNQRSRNPTSVETSVIEDANVERCAGGGGGGCAGGGGGGGSGGGGGECAGGGDGGVVGECCGNGEPQAASGASAQMVRQSFGEPHGKSFPPPQLRRQVHPSALEEGCVQESRVVQSPNAHRVRFFLDPVEVACRTPPLSPSHPPRSCCSHSNGAARMAARMAAEAVVAAEAAAEATEAAELAEAARSWQRQQECDGESPPS